MSTKRHVKNKQILLTAPWLHISSPPKLQSLKKTCEQIFPPWLWNAPNFQELNCQVIHQAYQPRLYQRLPTKGINPRSWTTSSWFAPRPWMWGFLFGTKGSYIFAFFPQRPLTIWRRSGGVAATVGWAAENLVTSAKTTELSNIGNQALSQDVAVHARVNHVKGTFGAMPFLSRLVSFSPHLVQ